MSAVSWFTDANLTPSRAAFVTELYVEYRAANVEDRDEQRDEHKEHEGELDKGLALLAGLERLRNVSSSVPSSLTVIGELQGIDWPTTWFWDLIVQGSPPCWKLTVVVKPAPAQIPCALLDRTPAKLGTVHVPTVTVMRSARACWTCRRRSSR